MTFSLRSASVILAVVVAAGWMATPRAAAVEFHSSASPTTLSGAQQAKNVFSIPGAGTVECSTANYSGTMVGTGVSSIEVKPEFSGCVAFGFATTHIITTSCGIKTAGLSAFFTGTLHFLCGVGKIKFTPTFFGTSVCTIEFPSQTPGGLYHVQNNAGENEFVVTLTTTGISHTAGCGASAAADATLTGSIVVRGNNSVWVT